MDTKLTTSTVLAGKEKGTGLGYFIIKHAIGGVPTHCELVGDGKGLGRTFLGGSPILPQGVLGRDGGHCELGGGGGGGVTWVDLSRRGWRPSIVI
jgi:hypothetical protein